MRKQQRALKRYKNSSDATVAVCLDECSGTQSLRCAPWRAGEAQPRIGFGADLACRAEAGPHCLLSNLSIKPLMRGDGMRVLALSDPLAPPPSISPSLAEAWRCVDAASDRLEGAPRERTGGLGASANDCCSVEGGSSSVMVHKDR